MSSGILASLEKEKKMIALEYISTSNFPNIAFDNLDSMIRDPLLSCQRKDPTDNNKMPT